MKRRLAVLVALALVALAAAWAWKHSGGGPGVDPERGEAPRGAEVPAPASLAAPGAVPAVAHGRATIEGIVRRGGKPARARVEVRFGHPTGGFLAGHTAERTLQEVDGFRPRPRALAIAETGDDGRFAIDGVSPGKNDVIAVAADGARGEATVEIQAEETRTYVVIALKPTSTLRGRARLGAVRPFRGRVAVTPASWSAQPREDDAVTVDADGRFAVTGLPAVPLYARYLADDGSLWFRPVPRMPLAEEWEVVIDDGATSLDGRVADAVTDAGIADARVVVNSSDGTSWLRVTVQTGADGRFMVPRLGGDFYAVAGAEGYAASSVERAPEVPFVIRLVRAATLRGTVTRRRDGQPVAGAELRLRSLATTQLGRPFGPAFTDARGRYELTGLPPSDVAVSVGAPGLSLPDADPDRSGWTSSSVRLESDVATTLDLVLDDAAIVRGRVLEDDGTRVARAVVSAVRASEWGTRMPDTSFNDRRWVAGDDGTFAIDVFPVGARVVLTATTAGSSATGSLPIACEPDLPLVELRLPARRAVRIHVVRADDGSPLPGVAIESPPAQPVAETEADGAAIVRLPLGQGATYRARLAGFAGKEVAITKDTAVVEIALARGRRLEGRVVRADGGPTSGVEVLTFDASGGIGSAGVSTDGRFEIDDVADGACRVDGYLARGDAVFTGTSIGRPGTPVVLTLSPPASAAAPAPIAPAASAPAGRTTVEITATGPDGHRIFAAGVRSVIGTSRGTARLNAGSTKIDVPQGASGSVEVSNPSDEFGRALPFAPGRADIGPTIERVEVRLGAGVFLEGRVEDPDGAPLPGIEVGVARRVNVRELADGWDLSGALASGRTDREGRFRLVSLADESDLRLVVLPPGSWLLPPARPVRVGEPGVVVRLLKAVSSTIAVVDPTGAAVPNVEVRADEEGRRDRGARPGRRTDALGIVRLGSLDPTGTYRLHVGVEGHPDLAPTDVEPWTPKDETIRLRGVGRLRIDVVDATGKTIPGAWLAIYGLNGSGRMFLESNGSFSEPSWPLGRTRVRAGADGYAPDDVDVDLGKDTPPVRIVLREGRDLRVRVDGAGRARPSWLAVYPEDRLDVLSLVGSDVADDGTAVLRGLNPGQAYVIWGPPEAGNDGYVLLRIPAIPEGEVRAPVLAGGTIHVRAKVPGGTRSTEVWASSGTLRLQGVPAADGASEVRGVPPGAWKIVVMTKGDDGESRASVAARPGDVVDVVVPPPE